MTNRPIKESDLVRLNIRLRRGQKEALEQYYPRRGYNAALREIIDLHLRKLAKREAELRAAKGITGEPKLNKETTI